MENFRFYIDRKNTIWDRSYYEVEAESLEDAKEIMMNVSDFGGEVDEWQYYAHDSETLYDTMSMMSVKENDGYATAELYFDDTDELITDNGEN